LVHKRLETGPDISTHPHYFVLSQSIAHPLIGINVAPDSHSKWNRITELGLSAAHIWSPTKC